MTRVGAKDAIEARGGRGPGASGPLPAGRRTGPGGVVTHRPVAGFLTTSPHLRARYGARGARGHSGTPRPAPGPGVRMTPPPVLGGTAREGAAGEALDSVSHAPQRALRHHNAPFTLVHTPTRPRRTQPIPGTTASHRPLHGPPTPLRRPPVVDQSGREAPSAESGAGQRRWRPVRSATERSRLRPSGRHSAPPGPHGESPGQRREPVVRAPLVPVRRRPWAECDPPAAWPDPPPDATPGAGKCRSAGWRGARSFTHTHEGRAVFVIVEAESVLHLSSDVMTVSI